LQRSSLDVAKSTAAFKSLNDYFGCLNSGVLYVKNSFKCALQIDKRVWKNLKEMQIYLSNVKTQGNKIYCIDGWLQTTEAILGIVYFLFNDNPELSYIAKGSNNCKRCEAIILKQGEMFNSPSEIFIAEKNFSNDSDLHWSISQTDTVQ